jgi:AcrR family transcriptional regulator
VSRSTFYEQFEDKEACFLGAFNFGVEYVLGQMREAWEAGGGDDAGSWRDHVRSDLTTYLDVLASEPAFARALHVESLAAGAATLERRAQMLALFSNRTRRLHELARAEEPALTPLPAAAFAVHTGGLDELIREHLRTTGAETLPALSDDAVAVTFALFGADP